MRTGGDDIKQVSSSASDNRVDVLGLQFNTVLHGGSSTVDAFEIIPLEYLKSGLISIQCELLPTFLGTVQRCWSTFIVDTAFDTGVHIFNLSRGNTNTTHPSAV